MGNIASIFNDTDEPSAIYTKCESIKGKIRRERVCSFVLKEACSAHMEQHLFVAHKDHSR